MTHGFFKEIRYFSRLGHVGANGYSAGAEGFDFIDDGGGGGRGAGVDDQGRTTRGELEGVSAAHTATRAGDEGNFAVEAGGGGCRWGGHIGMGR